MVINFQEFHFQPMKNTKNLCGMKTVSNWMKSHDFSLHPHLLCYIDTSDYLYKCLWVPCVGTVCQCYSLLSTHLSTTTSVLFSAQPPLLGSMSLLEPWARNKPCLQPSLFSSKLMHKNDAIMLLCESRTARKEWNWLYMKCCQNHE